jgi:hypothetical protein
VAPKALAAAAGVGAATSKAAPVPKSSAAAAPAKSTRSFAVDPMMAEPADASAAPHSFSEISELPPLKEVYVSPPPPPVDEQPEIVEPATLKKPVAEKTKVQVREAAQKAVHAIRRTPPKLYVYGVSAAIFLIALYLGGMALYNYMQDRDSGAAVTSTPATPAAQQEAAPAAQSAAPEASSPAPQAEAPDATQPEADQSEAAEPATAPARHARGRRAAARAVPAVVPAQLSVSSTPEGAQISFDGSALCQTPCTLTGIAPGHHMITATKAGYSSVSRNLAMLSGANSSVSIELTSLGASLTVASTPAGAVILLDGKDTGKLTPSQLSVNRSGSHTITLQRAGYLEQSSSVNVETGQAASVNLTLMHLGNTDDIRAAGGKFKKVFGRGGDISGMGIVSIKTQPKGAQIMINNRVLDKTTPFDFYLNPGTYVVDITMSGYKGLHRVISIQEGEKLAIQETLSTE